MSKQIKILMADDHPVFRAGLRQVLLSDPLLKIVRETGDGAEALRWARELKPDIAILDLDMPGLHGLDIARARQRERLPFEIIFLTTYRERDMFEEAVKKLGAKGYVLKESAEELGLSPRTVENHRTNMSAKLGLQGSHSLLKFAFDNRPRL